MTDQKKKSTLWVKAFPSLIAILIGLIVGVGVIAVSNPSAIGEALPKFFLGPFNRGLSGLGDLFYFAMPVLMTGLSVGFAFQTGLFNIGGSGQFLMGGFLAILVSKKLEGVVDPSFLWIIALLVAALGGALLASIVGVLKAYRNVNEVITCIMLNYTSMYLVNDFIKRFGIYNQMKNQTVDIAAEVPRMGLNLLFPGTITGGGILIALVCAIALHIILHRTTFGYELKGVGLNRYAARYAGINEKKSIILSMSIAGLLAGLAGGMLYLSGAGNHLVVQEVLPSQGFDGIAVALLGLTEPIGVVLASLFIAYVQMGGQAIQTLGFAPELITMIIAFILYISALSVLFQRLLKKKQKSDTNVNAEPAGPATRQEVAK